jgi:hypothetical protein
VAAAARHDHGNWTVRNRRTICANFSTPRQIGEASADVHALFGPAESFERTAAGQPITNGTQALPGPAIKIGAAPTDPAAELARCFLRLANLPNFALDRLSRYEAALWRQVSQALFALDVLDRRNRRSEGAVLISSAGGQLPSCARGEG